MCAPMEFIYVEHQETMRLSFIKIRREADLIQPERTTTSLKSRPFDANLATILSRGSKGDGNWSFAAFWLAVNASRRPKATGQKGPPDWAIERLY